MFRTVCHRTCCFRTLHAVLLAIATNMVGFAIAENPNVILIVSDDQGYNDLGLHGNGIITPALDRLAQEGTRLNNFYVAWPACTPSRAAFLTGRYPQRNGIYDMIRNEAPDYGHRYTPAEYAVTFERLGGMDIRETILPRMLKTAGYRSGIFGKWDLGSLRRFLPNSRGFDQFYGFVNTGIDYYTHERYGVPSMYRNFSPTVEDKGVYCTDLFEREATRFLNTHAGKDPFFLYLPFNAPHNSSALDPEIRSIRSTEFRKNTVMEEPLALQLQMHDGVTTGLQSPVWTRRLERSLRHLKRSNNSTTPLSFSFLTMAEVVELTTVHYEAEKGKCGRGGFEFPASSDGPRVGCLRGWLTMHF